MKNALNKLIITNHFIPDVKWHDIPQLAVITGVNGAGKTQILNAIYEAALKKNDKCSFNCETDLDLDEDEYSFVRWNRNPSNLGSSTYAQFGNEFEQFVGKCRTGALDSRDPGNWRLYTHMKRKLDVDLKNQEESFYESSEFVKAFKEAWTYTVETIENKHIARLFIQYKMHYEEKIQQAYDPETGTSIPQKQIEEALGKPPWVIINKLFSQYGFKYRINFPEKAISPFAVKFNSLDDVATSIAFNELSSGEQMIVTLILWSFNEELGSLKKLLLLDEPDAHLHPQMAKMFKEILSGIVVKKFGIQVIMTTHSPTTLCWIDEQNIFLMDPENGLERASKQEALSKLTSGLLYVHQAFKIVLVEDADDKKFHQRIYDEMAYSDFISKDPRLVFRSVVTSGVNSGGKSVVIKACKQWSEFSSQTDLDSVLFGLVDKDGDDNASLPCGVKALPRYCLENYLADPLLIFALMVEEQVDDNRIKDIAEKYEYRKGEALNFKNNCIEATQKIADEILEILISSDECALTADQTKAKVKIRYVNGVEVEIPERFLSESGKTVVLGYYKKTFAKEASRMNVHKLTDIAIITHLIPNDLVDIYKEYL